MQISQVIYKTRVFSQRGKPLFYFSKHVTILNFLGLLHRDLLVEFGLKKKLCSIKPYKKKRATKNLN